MGAGWEVYTKAYCTLEGWRAQYASPVVDTTVVGPQYGTTTMLAILASAAAGRGVGDTASSGTLAWPSQCTWPGPAAMKGASNP